MQALADRTGDRQPGPVRGLVEFATRQVALPPPWWWWWQAVQRSHCPQRPPKASEAAAARFTAPLASLGPCKADR
eukprot:CAMPEP_0168393488 /NCGR_PEP_ID=MMETSP0228-20121227/19044_1 /TAXON_ID=133427 /ORGANISM="Protoceratium reticulatum, Strain CCCM 535 (=CCMP 1889)" /LENGTH=74 /DNA_ID=CAMNT_0008406871 /DNA_START=17 /DNA_END=241 /DNA_ORIENTATION=+